ncbi:MAG TPA: DUF6122 family protein [Candidatus Paceibacterota bacterium]
MTTPTHIATNLGIFIILTSSGLISADYPDLVLLLSSDLIDLDHLFSKPIYHPRRNPFKTHFLHKHWIILGLISLGSILYRPLTFLGIGLVSHMLLDYLYTKREKV